MKKWVQCKRRDFIRKLKKLGFVGPYSGSRHQFMVYDHYRLAIPSNKQYSVPQLKMMIKEVEEIIDRVHRRLPTPLCTTPDTRAWVKPNRTSLDLAVAAIGFVKGGRRAGRDRVVELISNKLDSKLISSYANMVII